MLSLLLLILTVCVSAIVVRIGSIALELTGMPADKSFFQALSAFAGVGFTTKESELAVANPQRRKIMRILIAAGNAGIVTTVGTLAGALVASPQILNSMISQKYAMWFGLNPTQLTLIAIIVVLTLFYYALSQPAISRLINEVISTLLLREKVISPVQHEELVENGEGFGVVRVEISEANPLLGRTLGDVGLAEKLITVLSLERVDVAISYPEKTTMVELGDVLLVFGPLSVIRTVCLSPFELSSGSVEDSADAPLAVGTNAPDFTLKDQNGHTVALKSYLGRKTIILNFYPKDKSHYCSTVLRSFNERLAELRNNDIEVIAINPDSIDRHKDFCQMLNTDLPILSDAKKKVTRAYRSLMLGGLVVNRSIYVIGKDGKIAYAKRGRPPISEIIAAARAA